ncbi:MAG: membrane protein [Candidatus Roseilinea sp.]|nr:MAG: membrane protein [Candidatus Roseilinea sp.]
MKGKPLIIVGALAAIAAIVGVFVIALNLVSQQGARPKPGSPAPDFTLTLYPGYRADLPEQIRLSDLRGNVVVMNFWASWCVECYKEADALEAVYRKYKDRGVIFLGIDYLDTEAPALAYLKQYNVTYPNGLDVQQQIARAYRITGVPETFFIDKDGIVRDVVIAPLTEAQLIAKIEALLAE